MSEAGSAVTAAEGATTSSAVTEGATTQGSAIAAHAWMEGLPDELKADASLSRFEDPGSLAKSYVELRRTMGNRLAVPSADAPPEEWGRVWDALGRPKEATEYNVPLAEGADPADADGFRQLAHSIGLTQAQVKALGDFDLNRFSSLEASLRDAGKEELESLQTELGDSYEAKRAAAQGAFERVFGDEAGQLADLLDGQLGSRRLMEGFMSLAEMIGETGRVDGEQRPMAGASDAEAESTLNRLQADAGWRERIKNNDAQALAERSRLLDAAKRHALRGF